MLGDSSERLSRFVEGVREAGELAPQNCDQVDVQALEDAGKNIASNIQNYIVNVDLTKAQFDVDLLFEEAGRLGMDFGDLQEYGFETNGPNCNGTCISKNSFKNFDDALNKNNQFTERFLNEATGLYRRAQCHDGFRKTVTPKVQSVFSTFPFSCFTWPFAWAIDIPLCCCCCCLECPYQCCF